MSTLTLQNFRNIGPDTLNQVLGEIDVARKAAIAGGALFWGDHMAETTAIHIPHAQWEIGQLEKQLAAATTIEERFGLLRKVGGIVVDMAKFAGVEKVRELAEEYTRLFRSYLGWFDREPEVYY